MLPYICDKCGKLCKDSDNEITWITSSYGVCQDCYDDLDMNGRLEEVRDKYE